MKQASLLASAAFVVSTACASAAYAQETYPEITTPGFANEIDGLISKECSDSVYGDDVYKNIACADVTLAATSKVLLHLSSYIKQETGQTISYFWAGAAQGGLLGCASRLDSATNNSGVKLYPVIGGDTLSEIIADEYGLIKWADISEAYKVAAANNGIKNPDLIRAGNKIVLFDDPTKLSFVGNENPDIWAYLSKSHTVASDCLRDIDDAENGIEQWVDTPAQNHVVNLLNCQVNPDGCVRSSAHRTLEFGGT